jgi:hypothetical protein
MTALTTLLLSGLTASSWVIVMICGVSAGESPPGADSDAQVQPFSAWQFAGLQLYQLGKAVLPAASARSTNRRIKYVIFTAGKSSDSSFSEQTR